MINRLPLTDSSGEVRELTEEDFMHFRPATEVLNELFSPEIVAEMLAPKKGGRPLAENTKKLTSIRFDTDVLDSFKSTGKGWQTRMNNALREWLNEHPDLKSV